MRSRGDDGAGGMERSRHTVLVLSLLLLAAAPARAQTPADAGCGEAAWGMDEIAASRVAGPIPESTGGTAGSGGVLVLEDGGKFLTVLDDERLEPVYRFPAPAGPAVAVRLSPDGRHGFLASRDGWIAKIDLRGRAVVAKARSGLDLTGVALSADGRYLAAGHARPCTLALLSAADLAPLKVIPGTDAKAGAVSRIGSVEDAGARGSFLVALADLPEVWEVYYRDDAPKIYRGFVHSHEAGMTEGFAEDGRLGARHIAVERPLQNLTLLADHRNALGTSSEGDGVVVVNLTVGRPVAAVALPGEPDLAGTVPGRWQGRPVLTVLHRTAARLTLVDAETWRILSTVALRSPATFVRGHDGNPYAWAGMAEGGLDILDPRTWEVVRTVRWAGGQPPADALFTRGGERILISVTEPDGAVIAEDGRSFAEIKRIPLVRPSVMHAVGK